MRTIPLKEVLALDPGETIPQTRGVLKAVFPMETGKRADGNDWTRQNCVLADGPTEIKVKVWNHEPLESLKGRKVWLIAYKSPKDGKLSGLTFIEDNYTNKKGEQVTARLIEASAKAEITRDDAPKQSEADPDDGDLGPQSGGQRAPEPAKWTANGPAMGGILKSVCDNLTARSMVLDPNLVWEMGSDLLRVLERLEKGQLAPSWKERHKQPVADQDGGGVDPDGLAPEE